MKALNNRIDEDEALSEIVYFTKKFQTNKLSNHKLSFIQQSEECFNLKIVLIPIIGKQS